MKLIPFATFALSLACSFSHATNVLTPVSLAGAVASTSGDPFGFPPDRAIDGVTHGINPNFTHTNNGANEFWRLDLPANITADVVRIYNRTDCCAGRLNGAVVNVFSDAAQTSSVFSSSPISGTPARIDFRLPSGSSVRSMQVNQQNEYLSLAEVQFFTINNVTLPLGTNLGSAGIASMTYSQSSEYLGGQFPAGNAADGNMGNFSHTDGGNPANPWWKAAIGEPMLLQSVSLNNRGDGCCQERFRDLQVEVLDASGSPVWTSSVLNPGNSLVSPQNIFLDLQALNGGLPILGSQVRVSRIVDATGGIGPDDSRVLSMGEVIILGGSIPEPSVSLCAAAALGLLGIRRRRQS